MLFFLGILPRGAARAGFAGDIFGDDFLARRKTLVYRGDSFSALRVLRDEERGKNTTATLVFSESRRDPFKQKQWVRKSPYSRPQDSSKYDLADAAKDVLVSRIIAAIRGKHAAPKAKFTLMERGMVSRIIGDDFRRTKDLFRVTDTDSHASVLTPAHKEELLYNLVLGIILENRDMRVENFIYSPDSLYAIDFEYVAADPPPGGVTVAEILRKLHAEPNAFIKILMDRNFAWNLVKFQSSNDYTMSWYQRCLLPTIITSDKFVTLLRTITAQLAADDFKVCRDARENIRRKFSYQSGVYSTAEINDSILPTMDRTIARIKRNVAIVNTFLAWVASESSPPTHGGGVTRPRA